MNETSSVQKQDLRHMESTLDAILRILEEIRTLLEKGKGGNP